MAQLLLQDFSLLLSPMLFLLVNFSSLRHNSKYIMFTMTCRSILCPLMDNTCDEKCFGTLGEESSLQKLVLAKLLTV